MENEVTPEGGTEADAPLSDAPKADLALQCLVKLAHVAAGVSVTLFVRGTIIGGTIITGHEYFRRVEARLREALGGVDGRLLLFGDLPEKVYPAESEKEGPEIDRIGYIHLKNYEVRNGSYMVRPTNENDVWRGTLESVDGFNIGTTRPPDSDTP